MINEKIVNFYNTQHIKERKYKGYQGAVPYELS